MPVRLLVSQPLVAPLSLVVLVHLQVFQPLVALERLQASLPLAVPVLRLQFSLVFVALEFLLVFDSLVFLVFVPLLFPVFDPLVFLVFGPLVFLVFVLVSVLVLLSVLAPVFDLDGCFVSFVV